MATSFVGENGTASNNPTSGNWDLTGVSFAAGDLGICWWYTSNDTKTVTEPASVTQKYDVSSSGFGRLFIGYRWLQSGDTTFGWTASDVLNSTTCWGISVYRFDAAGTGDPFTDESGAPQTFTDTNDPDPPSVAVSTNGSCVIVIVGKNNDITSGTPSTNYSNGGFETSNAGDDATGGIQYRLGVNISTEDPDAITFGGGAVGDDGYIWTAAMKPITGATTTHPGWYGMRGGWW